MKIAQEVLNLVEEESPAPKVADMIKELISTKWSGSNDDQGKAVQLMKGLAFSDDPMANKFMKAVDDFTSGLNPKDYE